MNALRAQRALSKNGQRRCRGPAGRHGRLYPYPQGPSPDLPLPLGVWEQLTLTPNTLHRGSGLDPPPFAPVSLLAWCSMSIPTRCASLLPTLAAVAAFGPVAQHPPPPPPPPSPGTPPASPPSPGEPPASPPQWTVTPVHHCFVPECHPNKWYSYVNETSVYPCDPDTMWLHDESGLICQESNATCAACGGSWWFPENQFGCSSLRGCPTFEHASTRSWDGICKGIDGFHFIRDWFIAYRCEGCFGGSRVCDPPTEPWQCPEEKLVHTGC